MHFVRVRIRRPSTCLAVGAWSSAVRREQATGTVRKKDERKMDDGGMMEA